MDAVQLGRRRLRTDVRDHRPYQRGHQAAGQGVQLAVGDREPGRGEQRGLPDAQPVGGGPGVREAQGAGHPGELLAGGRAVGLGDGAAGHQQPYGPLQHPGAGQLELGGAVMGLGEGAQQRQQTAGHLVLRQRRLDGPHEAERVKSSRVVRAAFTEQPASADAVCGSTRPAGASESSRSIRAAARAARRTMSRKTRSNVERRALVTLGAQLLGEVGDGRLGPVGASQPPASTSAAGWPAHSSHEVLRRRAGRR